MLKRARTAKWSPPRTTITYNGIDTADFPIREQGTKEWGWRLLYVGRVEERKGVHVAVDALANLPEQATLTIDGPLDDSFVPSLRARIEELGLGERVVMQNSKRVELAGVYAAADVLLFPVLWEEPFGLVPLEAMACATPVVATGTGGSGEFLLDGANCLLTKPGDVQSLVSAVQRLAGDEDLRRRLVEGGRRTARNLDVDEYARVLENWHRAAAIRFAEGEPAPRPTLSELLATLQQS